MSTLPSTLLIATQNRDKIKEISDILQHHDIVVRSLLDYPEIPPIEETGTTLKENATLKAKTAFELTGLMALADDTGLEVDALDGAPGIYSSRFSGPGATYESNVKKLLEDMEGIPEAERSARFRCVMALVWKDGQETVEGQVEGVILREVRGIDGFGYDPVFYHPPTGMTFAEMPLSVKNQYSHRSIALRKMVDLIVNMLTS